MKKNTCKLVRVICFASLTGFSVTLSASNSFAENFFGRLKNVAITDVNEANKAPVALFTYTKNDDIITFDASSSSDTDGNIVSYKWDFGDGQIGSGLTVNHQYAAGEYNPTLTISDNDGGVSIYQQSISNKNTFSLNVNFQPATSQVPDNYLVDSGKIFDAERGYGWVSTPYYGTRDRDNSLSPDQAYDTNIMPRANDVWKVKLPNGVYQVTICVGDPYYPSSTNIISIEGIEFINTTVTSSNKWVEKTNNITIADGEMTVTFTGSPNYLQICWIKIHSI